MNESLERVTSIMLFDNTSLLPLLIKVLMLLPSLKMIVILVKLSQVTKTRLINLLEVHQEIKTIKSPVVKKKERLETLFILM